MQTYWEINGSDSLVLFFSGWAMDENPTKHVCSAGPDVCVCFDYNTLETFDSERWKQYRDIHLVAWSTGVWAAEAVLGGLQLPVSSAVAINGAPTTVHEVTGIQRAVFEATYEHLTPQSLAKFHRRMVGGASAYGRFAGIAPKRDLVNQRSELRKILDVDFSGFHQPRIHWDLAIVGMHDAVFPPAAQRAYWKLNSVAVVEMDIPHYPFFEITDWDLFSVSRYTFPGGNKYQ